MVSESRGYVERPIAVWYAVFDGDTPVDYRVPWPIPKGKTLRRSDLDDFTIRLDLPGGLRLYGQGPDDGGSTTVFVPPDEVGADRRPGLRPRPEVPRRPHDPALPAARRRVSCR